MLESGAIANPRKAQDLVLAVGSRPSSLPKHLRNVGKEEEVSTKDPQEFPHLGGRVIHATKATQKKGSETIPSCSQDSGV